MRCSNLISCMIIIVSLFMCISCNRSPSGTTITTPQSAELTPFAPMDDGIPEQIVTTPFPTIVASADLPSDFALIFGYGARGITRRLDTFTRTLTQIPQTTAPITIALTLTPTELELIYQKLVAISFFSYPEHFTANLPDTMVRVSASEYPSYEFVMRADNRVKHVRFDDKVSRPITTEVKHLREAVTLIDTIVSEQEELAVLPLLEETCP